MHQSISIPMRVNLFSIDSSVMSKESQLILQAVKSEISILREQMSTKIQEDIKIQATYPIQILGQEVKQIKKMVGSLKSCGCQKIQDSKSQIKKIKEQISDCEPSFQPVKIVSAAPISQQDMQISQILDQKIEELKRKLTETKSIWIQGKGVKYRSDTGEVVAVDKFLGSQTCAKDWLYEQSLEFTALSRIQISDSENVAEAMKYLTSSKFPKLRILSLENLNMGDEGVKELIKGDFPSLEELYLNKNQITDEGVKTLISRSFLTLKVLNVQENQIGYEGMQCLMTSGSKFPKLVWLHRDNQEIKSQIKTQQ